MVENNSEKWNFIEVIPYRNLREVIPYLKSKVLFSQYFLHLSF